SPGADSHSYDPSPKDMLAISKCDVFIYVGGASDAWVEEILASAENATMKVIKLMDHTEGLLCSDHDHEHGDGHSHDHGEYDEHVWTSPRNAALACEAIAAALCEADVENAGVYETNLAAYKAELAALDAEFKSIVENGARKELVFGDRFPLIYFTEAYGLAYSSAFPGCAGDTEPSALAVAELINKVKEENIPAVFCLGLSADNIANTICEATGARKLTFHSCENVSKDDFAAGETYVSLMKKNANALREALA
ncbi:MAG: zinc ABC transporter substrate-binding protein, partial [Clostridia bacterium]|nr:zinc ABC transporter substrate-binding protein [Clostridia bacterium]